MRAVFAYLSSFMESAARGFVYGVGLAAVTKPGILILAQPNAVVMLTPAMEIMP